MKYAAIVVAVIAIALLSTAMIYAYTWLHKDRESLVKDRGAGPIESQDILVSDIGVGGNFSGIGSYIPVVATYYTSQYLITNSSLGPLGLYSPIAASFPYSVYRVVSSEYFASMALTVEPHDFVENNVIGAGRWYAFEVKIFYLLGLSSTRTINVSFTASSLNLVIYYNGTTWATLNLPPYASVAVENASGSEAVVLVNATFPWSFSGDLNITGLIIDQYNISTRYSWSYKVVNTTSIRLSTAPKQSYGIMEYIVLNGTVTYTGTSIPVTRENINVSIKRSTIVATTNTTVDNNGFFEVTIKTPSTPGTYNLILDPEHGEPITYTIEVTKELGGEAIPLYENIVLIILLLLAVILSTSLVLYRRSRE